MPTRAGQARGCVPGRPRGRVSRPSTPRLVWPRSTAPGPGKPEVRVHDVRVSSARPVPIRRDCVRNGATGAVAHAVSDRVLVGRDEPLLGEGSVAPAEPSAVAGSRKPSGELKAAVAGAGDPRDQGGDSARYQGPRLPVLIADPAAGPLNGLDVAGLQGPSGIEAQAATVVDVVESGPGPALLCRQPRPTWETPGSAWRVPRYCRSRSGDDSFSSMIFADYSAS